MLIYLSELRDNPEGLLVLLAALGVAFVTGIAFHEFSHAASAYQLGDNTAARQGRLSLNPARHLDPTGTLLLFLVGFGWGKPTPFNPYRLRNGPKVGSAIVALAGPLSNFVIAAIAALPLKLGLVDLSISSFDEIENASGGDLVFLFLFFIVSINILLGVFNLLPLAPLDGFKVALGVLPDETAREFSKLEPYGVPILFGMLIIGFVTNGAIDPLGSIINFFREPIFDFLAG